MDDKDNVQEIRGAGTSMERINPCLSHVTKKWLKNPIIEGHMIQCKLPFPLCAY